MTTTTKSLIMKEAHRIAREELTGDYVARLKAGLKKAWKNFKNKIKGAESIMNKITVKRIGGYSRRYKVLKNETVELSDRTFELPSELESEGEKIYLEYSVWEKYGKQRIYVSVSGHEGYFGVGEKSYLSAPPSELSWLLAEIWKRRGE